MHFICLEAFSGLWKAIPVFDLNFSLQQPKPITSFSVITTRRHDQTPRFLSPPSVSFQLGAASLYPQDCTSSGQVPRLNQHIEICPSAQQQPGAVGSPSSQQKCCQHASEGLCLDYLSFGFRAFNFSFSNEVEISLPCTKDMVQPGRSPTPACPTGRAAEVQRICASTVPRLPSPPGKTSQFH